MVTRGKSINLFLMDGDPSGRIKCTLANWTGVAYKIPRTELEKCKGRDDLSQSGVYFLFGSSDQTGENVAYVGQAGVRKNGEGILYRLQEHKRNPDKDYWTEAVVFTTSNNSFGPTEISYLENRFTNMAASAKRYLVKNSNDPTSGNITEEKESELEEFIDYARIVMGTLGHKVFEPILQTSPVAASQTTTPSTDDQAFYIKRSGANAKSRLTNEGIVVLAGSVLRKVLVPSCPDSAKAARDYNKENIDDKNVLLIDVLFKTPSGASSFVLGAPTNGNIEWKTEDGRVMKDAENGGIEP
ncbi:GIY-YIG nuclease family protein [Eubacteriales bacterium OttesenSCG-928-N13]|nr:GIY-YIG nuclease family protein [Eubacteriales bacterium OttesenSCG-928-N13]